ncbi:hypothetical protein RDV89_03035 [Nocardioides zeae]|uniref:Phosphodiesterase n=1 Tax=Nocardioides imazamoxiresistens TaxID=3231893 RepID=A0ABU3PS19_9ACTN|nr:hypothetical protein [Nocardioides zeae]MDT9592025.1 hypothetical protein [Nocardioides zeae]
MPQLVPPVVTALPRAAARAAGEGLAGVTRAVAALRPGAKPLHPAGTVVRGRLTRHGASDGAPPTGVDLLDRPGEGEVVVRLSRAVGLPHPVPDVWGLALRLQHEGETGDLLLASTGWRGPLRHVLVPRWEGSDRPLTTLLPYRTPTGPVLIGARSTDQQEDGAVQRWTLSWARGLGPWHAFADLEIEHPVGDALDGEDEEIEFDPVLHQVSGLRQYPTVRRLRRPAYRTAQRTH